MILAHENLRVVESVDRRILGAILLVDSVTNVPVTDAAHFEALEATLMGLPGLPAVTLPEGSVKIRQNRRGVHVLMSAPLFEDYTAAFENPQAPADTQNGPLRLRLALSQVNSAFLPQELFFDIPRSLDRATPQNVFTPLVVPLFRSPSSGVQDGWILLRVRVTRTGTNPPEPVPGVLISVFAAPRVANDQPIGEGMTDWRGRSRGEALAPVTGVLRFFPGNGGNPVVSEQSIAFEARRESGFTGLDSALPNVMRLRAGTSPDLVRPPDLPPGSQLEVLSPEMPLMVRSGREYVVHLSMP